jgi:hypothetical protein
MLRRHACDGRHTDKHALTVNILLQEGSFEGAGTAFWTENELELCGDSEPSLLPRDARSGDASTRQGGAVTYEDGTTEAPTLTIKPLAGVVSHAMTYEHLRQSLASSAP